MGHMALFADPDFAQFSQEIGLASLGASEQDLKYLATVIFYLKTKKIEKDLNLFKNSIFKKY